MHWVGTQNVTSDRQFTKIRMLLLRLFSYYCSLIFRKAKSHHPDVNPTPESQEEFIKIRESFQILNNEMQRAEYDRTYHSGYVTLAKTVPAVFIKA